MLFDPQKYLPQVCYVVLFFTLASNSNAGPACALPDRGNVSKAWDSVLAGKKRILQDAITALEREQAQLKGLQRELGDPGSSKAAANAVALVVSETADLINMLGAAFGASSTAVEVLGKVREKVDDYKQQADYGIRSKTESLLDPLKSVVPGLKLAEKVEDWQEASGEIRRQQDALSKILVSLRKTVSRLGGVDRASSIDDLIARGSPSINRCEPPNGKVRSKVLPPPVVKAPASSPSNSSTQPMEGACEVFSSC